MHAEVGFPILAIGCWLVWLDLNGRVQEKLTSATSHGAQEVRVDFDDFLYRSRC